MNDTSQDDLQAFMRAVESREPRVYQEEVVSVREILLIISPLLVGSAVGFVAIFRYLSTSPEPVFLSLMLSIMVPLLVGIIVMFLIVFRRESQAREYGLKGVSRSSLSLTILFLDMILNGYVDTGEIADLPRPEEYLRSSQRGYGTTIYTLKKLDHETGDNYADLIREKILSTMTGKERLFAKVFPFALITAAAALLVAMVSLEWSMIPEQAALVALAAGLIAAVLLMCGLGINAVRTRGEEPRPELEMAISEPDLKTQTSIALDRLLETILSEGEHPLRVLTISDYDELRYTGTTYTTEKGMTLREAVLIPRRTELENR
ncbi:MAG: hypothetical protein ACXADO_04705 [Candidatus Thorarchaeota archaeon]